MIHNRPDYQLRIVDLADTDPSLFAPGTHPIAEDEPVMLFRASDKHFSAVVNFYLGLVMTDSEPPAPGMVDSLLHQLALVWQWQQANPTKVPDLPADIKV